MVWSIATSMIGGLAYWDATPVTMLVIEFYMDCRNAHASAMDDAKYLLWFAG